MTKTLSKAWPNPAQFKVKGEPRDHRVRIADPVERSSGVGFMSPREDVGGKPHLLPSEGHVMTIAPTGSGKTLSCAVPVLLQYPGTTIVLDVRGELSAITARRRAEMGHKVLIVDPEGITGRTSAGFNPLSLVEPDTANAFTDARSISQNLLPDEHSDRDVFWRNRAVYYLTTAMLRARTHEPPQRQNLVAVRDEIHRFARIISSSEPTDPEQVRARLRRTRPGKGNRALERAESILGMGSTDTTGGMLHTAMEGVGFIEGQGIETCLAGNDVSLDEITEGEPVTIYLVLPPHSLASLSVLMRLWFSTIFAALMRRGSRPEHPTLVMIDEAAQLGHFEPLRQAITLLRGYGVQTWTFWQDPGQIRSAYPRDWASLVNNCRVVQAFGRRSASQADQYADALGVDAGLFRSMTSDQMVLGIDGDYQIAKRIDYRSDPVFAGAFDPNPIYEAASGRLRRPEKVVAPVAEPLKSEPGEGFSRLLSALMDGHTEVSASVKLQD